MYINVIFKNIHPKRPWNICLIIETVYLVATFSSVFGGSIKLVTSAQSKSL